MPTRLSSIAGVLLLALPATASAAEKSDPRLQAILACETVSASDARLNCYDAAIAALKPALAQGKVVLEEKKGPLAMEGVVKASTKSASNRFLVEFENGDRWDLVTVKPRRAGPPVGSTLKLKKTFFGNYWASGPKWSESEADFLGHTGS